MKTLVLSKQDIIELISMPELIQAIEQAYITYSADKIIKPQRSVAQVKDSSVVVNLPGYLPGSSAFTVKVNVKTPSNQLIGLPFLMGTILLIDQKTGRLLSILDSGLITAMRTGAAGAVGVKCLANPKATTIALIGAGIQAEWQIRALHSIERVSSVYIYDIVESQAKKLANKVSSELGISCFVVSSAREAIQQSEVVISTTQSKNPVIDYNDLHPGVHINAFGADQPGKVELSSQVINNCFLAVDDKNLATTDGALNVASQQKQIVKDKNIPEIGEILSGKQVGRTTQKDITVFGNVGLAFQDLVACQIIYENALKLKKGTWIDLDNSLEIPSNNQSKESMFYKTATSDVSKNINNGSQQLRKACL